MSYKYSSPPDFQPATNTSKVVPRIITAAITSVSLGSAETIEIGSGLTGGVNGWSSTIKKPASEEM